MTSRILCQIDHTPRLAKPETLSEYGKLRDKMIQGDWQYLWEAEFVQKVTQQGCPFYGCLFKGRDLMELGQQKDCWHTQTIIGLDFDKCEVSPWNMIDRYAAEDNSPWLVYRTFSDAKGPGHSYRMLWKVDVNLNVSYEQVRTFIKEFAKISGGYADKHSMDPSRMWQGSRNGRLHWDPQAKLLKVN